MPMYNVAKGHSGIDWENDTFKACLMKCTFTPDYDDDTMDVAIGTFECNATDYQRIMLTNKALEIDDTLDVVNHKADDITFIANSDVGTVDKILIYKEVTDDTDSIPLLVLSFATPRATYAAPTDPTKNNTISTAFPNGIVYSGRSA